MNQIKKIKIENIKGKKEFACDFNSFDANYPNLLVAPNGFGKSTLAVAFEALKVNKIELNKQDLYEKDEKNKPTVEMKLVGEYAGIYSADASHNDISKNINISVINSPIYAKGKSKNFGRFSTNEAVMNVEEIVIESKIPKNCKIEEVKMQKVFHGLGKIFFSLKDIFQNIHDMNVIVELLPYIKKIYTQKSTLQALENFCRAIITASESKCTAVEIRSIIKLDDVEKFLANNKIAYVGNEIARFKGLPCDKNNKAEVCLVLVQLIENVKKEDNDFKAALKWLKYQELRKTIDENIELFNTTHRKIKTQVKKDKLLVQFPAANEMSNGERDVITFIIQILKFKSTFQNNIGILIMDEIFDYLDGSNMLIAQYYLSKYIEVFRQQGKNFFSVILTHLDPYLFKNYYFKNIKVHYLKEFANTSGNDMIKFLKIRASKNKYPDIVEKIEKGYLHFFNNNILLTNEEQVTVGNNKYFDAITFKDMVNGEVDKYLCDEKYDPLKVICGIRIKIEEIVFKLLGKDEEKEEFFETHTTAKKLNYVEEKVGGVSENLYLLAPLYNDALHMDLKDDTKNKNKVKSICLKLDNLVVKKIVKEIFE